ncbi:MAG: class I SAM-dependent methyltransferase, partial [Clostridia bacterium]|nr:class I SAM-dependent methyltransferase [Clostridia bacterium]
SYLQGSVEKIPLEDHSVDVVVSFETIEHVSAELQVRMMEEIKRVLKDDGILFISSPDKRYYSEERGFDNPYHVHELYAAEFKTLLEKYFSHVKFAGQRFLYGCLAVWNDKAAGEMVLYDDLTRTQSTELRKPHYLLAVAGNGALPAVFNSIVEYTPDAMLQQELLRRPDPVELFIADPAEQWRPAAVSVNHKETSGSRTGLEMDFTCGELPRLRIDIGCPGYQYRLEKLQIVSEDKPAVNLLMPDSGCAANAFVEFGSEGGEKIPTVIPYTDDPQLYFDLPADFAGKQCRLAVSFSPEAVVTSGIVARKIAELNNELAQYHGLTSSVFYKLYECSEKMFPRGSRRRRFLGSIRSIFKK